MIQFHLPWRLVPGAAEMMTLSGYPHSPDLKPSHGQMAVVIAMQKM